MKAAVVAMDKELMFVWGCIKTRTGVNLKFSENKKQKDSCVAEYQWDPQGQQMHTIAGYSTYGYGLLRHSNVWSKDERIRWAWTELNMPVDLIRLVELGWEPPQGMQSQEPRRMIGLLGQGPCQPGPLMPPQWDKQGTPRDGSQVQPRV